jgi:hypothetical protein
MLGLVTVPISKDGYQYTASKKSKVFHKITYKHVATIKEENLINFYSLEEAKSFRKKGM